MERVKKEEKYWYLYLWGAAPRVTPDREGLNPPLDAERFAFGNYFHTQEEAESMSKKLRAVLKGADVIEMPSEEESGRISDDNFEGDPYWSQYDEMCESAYGDGWYACYEWLKSKIVK